MRLAILSDTHVPGRANGIPSQVETTVREADLVTHADDFGLPTTFDHLHDLSTRFVDVNGNVDPPDIDLPFIEIVEVDGPTFVVTHGTDMRTGYESRVAKAARDTVGTDTVGVVGHIYEMASEVVDGIRALNSGTTTMANPGDGATVMAGTVTDSSMLIEVVRND